MPPVEQFAERLDPVLAAIYATFVQGWDDPAGLDPRARGLANEAIELGRLVARAYLHESEALGLLALMLHANARSVARRDGARYVPLDEQNTARWDVASIDEAEMWLARAARVNRIGRYQLEAALQSAHSARRFGREPDWQAIVALYDALVRFTDSPVVRVNRAVAFARVSGVRAALTELDGVAHDERLQTYQPYWAARAKLLDESGDREAAREAYSRALGLAVDPAVRDYLARCVEGVGAP